MNKLITTYGQYRNVPLISVGAVNFISGNVAISITVTEFGGLEHVIFVLIKLTRWKMPPLVSMLQCGSWVVAYAGQSIVTSGRARVFHWVNCAECETYRCWKPVCCSIATMLAINLCKQRAYLGCHNVVSNLVSRRVKFASRSFGLTSKAGQLAFSEEVQEALETRKPLVALESTIITHGLPFPTNLEMATTVENIIRNEGAIPATTAFIDGVAKVGLSSAELEALANRTETHKVSRRDISHVISRKLTGGTTISATMILAYMAGIKVFATGGLGGVHRGVSDHWDISADLEELGKTPVAVICSGPKSILDIPKTIEYLETQGCHVSTFNSDGGPVNVPGFFTTDSGVPSPFTFTNPFEAASTIHEGTKFGLNSGYLFCVPAAPEIAMDSRIVNSAIEFALIEARNHNITGKEVTPFLLKKVWEATGGDSVKTNVEFVKANALMGSRIAKTIAALEEGQLPEAVTLRHTPSRNSQSAPHISSATTSKNVTDYERRRSILTDKFSAVEVEKSPDFAITSTKSIHMPVQLKPRVNQRRSLGPPLSGKIDVCVIGALSQDITCTLNAENISVSSYPGRITTSLGGTAHNVALASAYCGAKTKLISCIGDREEAEISKSLSPAIDVSGVRVSDKERTPRYVCTNDARGELIVACADMDAVYNLDKDFIGTQIDQSRPEVIVFDGNVGPDQQSAILSSKQRDYDPIILFEPTSVPKAARLADLKDLKVFPNSALDIATPNYLELMSMFEEFSYKERFDVHNWFPIIDQLPLSDSFTRMKLDIFARSHPVLENVIVSGLVQASLQLLPYIPNLFVTNGSNGVISFQLVEHLKDRTGGVKDGPNSVYILSKDRSYGVLIQHFPVTVEVSADDAKSVNGIGDTFCGALVAQLSKSRAWLRDDGPMKKEIIGRAMHAASISLQTYQAVNSEIASLFNQN